MSLNDELLTLNDKIKYYTFETFNSIPAEPGVYAWFYPLRLKTRELSDFIEEINLILNFCDSEKFKTKPQAEVNLGWRNYLIETKFKNIDSKAGFLKEWENLFIEASKTGNHKAIEEIKKIIFISSVFMPPLYIGKATNLHDRCQQHVEGSSNNCNIFHNRFREFTKQKNMSCRNIEDLIFACISTKKFDIEDGKYENLIERILMNLVKPVFSIR